MSVTSASSLLRKPALLVLTPCILLFHLANAAMLPLVGSDDDHALEPVGDRARGRVHRRPAARRRGHLADASGELAQRLGPAARCFLIGFAVLPLRGALLAWTSDPYMIVAVQTLDGISGAVLGVLVPLTLADISRGTGRFNLAQGIVGSATGVGAALSTIGAGYLADRFGTSTAFAGLAAVAVAGFCCAGAADARDKPVPRARSAQVLKREQRSCPKHGTQSNSVTALKPLEPRSVVVRVRTAACASWIVTGSSLRARDSLRLCR